jgi:glycosyltransferase involved in cell wall biosynthesis
VVPNVLPLKEVEVAAPGSPYHMIVVADLVDRVKNITGVLEAMALLREEIPHLRLTVVGGGPDERKLRQLCSGFNLNDRVMFLGKLSATEAMERMAASGFMVVNSRSETFSVVTGEALMLGKPVIATRCGGPEAFINEHNGALIPVENTPALADAIKRMVAQHGSYAPERIRAGVNERYSAHAIGKQFYTIYQRALTDRD